MHQNKYFQVYSQWKEIQYNNGFIYTGKTKITKLTCQCEYEKDYCLLEIQTYWFLMSAPLSKTKLSTKSAV